MPQAMDHFDILKTKLQLILPSLPRSEKAAATYLVENLHRIGSLNLNTISAETNSSGATIIRLCKHMGYRGFLDFRNSVRMAEYPPYDGGDAVLPARHPGVLRPPGAQCQLGPHPRYAPAGLPDRDALLPRHLR